MAEKTADWLTDTSAPFELVEQLGSGGFAVTWRAKVRSDAVEEFGAAEVAVKIPLDTMQRVLKREVQLNDALKSLRALNLVRYLGFEVFRGRLVMVMELVEGGNLRHLLQRVGGASEPLQTVKAIEISIGVLDGLAAIHAQNIVHRDIKPENVLMDGMTPKISDFGIAKLIEEGKRARTAVGTEFYVAPEVLSGAGASFNCDLWSLGVVLYEMVTGRLPFAGLSQILMNPHLPACEANPAVPRQLSAIIDRTLQKEPSQRYQYAIEMRAELEAVLREERDRVDEQVVAKQVAALRSGTPDQEALVTGLKEILQAHPSAPLAYRALAEVLSESHRHVEAVGVYRRGVQRRPENARLHLHLGCALMATRQSEEARLYLQLARDLGLDEKGRRIADALIRTATVGAGSPR